MSKRLDENLGYVAPDNLIAGMYPPAEPFTVKIRKETTETVIYKRGTVMALSSGSAGDSKFLILGTAAATDETLTANCVIAEDAEVGTDVDSVAIAYRTGHFNENVLVVAKDYTLNAADKEALRTVGILLSDAVTI
jgi:hypothetical protein